MSDRSPWTPDKVRQRIQVGTIIDKLHKHLNGDNQMSQTQLKAAEILLRKSLPDLSNTQITGELTHSYVMALPQAIATTTEWQQTQVPARLQS